MGAIQYGEIEIGLVYGSIFIAKSILEARQVSREDINKLTSLRNRIKLRYVGTIITDIRKIRQILLNTNLFA